MNPQNKTALQILSLDDNSCTCYNVIQQKSFSFKKPLTSIYSKNFPTVHEIQQKNFATKKTFEK